MGFQNTTGTRYQLQVANQRQDENSLCSKDDGFMGYAAASNDVFKQDRKS